MHHQLTLQKAPSGDLYAALRIKRASCQTWKRVVLAVQTTSREKARAPYLSEIASRDFAP